MELPSELDIITKYLLGCEVVANTSKQEVKVLVKNIKHAIEAAYKLGRSHSLAYRKKLRNFRIV